MEAATPLRPFPGEGGGGGARAPSVAAHAVSISAWCSVSRTPSAMFARVQNAEEVPSVEQRCFDDVDLPPLL